MASARRRQGHLEFHAGEAGAQRDILLPVMQVVRAEEIAGGPLLVAAVAALVWVNAAPHAYAQTWETLLTVAVAGVEWQRSLHYVVNDALLPLFFFVAGLELKRELVRGELSTVRAASLPLVMAVGGMVAPAVAYLLVARGTPAAAGWGVPVATDIAFALALVAVLGRRVPNEVRVALLAFAALDDVGGVIVIAATSQATLSAPLLGLAALLLAATYGSQRVPLLPSFLTVLTGIGAFMAVMASGLHPTLAGIALGLTVPAKPLIGRERYLERTAELTAELGDLRARRSRVEAQHQDAHTLMEQEDALLGRLEALTVATESTLDRVARTLNPWVSYLILPLFALANGGLVLDAATIEPALSGVVFWSVLTGLLAGKPLGILGATWVAARLGLVRLPGSMRWGDVAGLGLIAGIGFTVSLFIADLAFGGQPSLASAKLGVLCASVLAGLSGSLVLAWVHRGGRRKP